MKPETKFKILLAASTASAGVIGFSLGETSMRKRARARVEKAVNIAKMFGEMGRWMEKNQPFEFASPELAIAFTDRAHTLSREVELDIAEMKGE